MKISLRFLRDQLSKKLTGAVLFSGLCLSSFAQTNPIETPKSTDYPGILETFEKLIQIDNTRFRKKTDLLSTTGKTLSDASTVTNLDLEPDFLNSLILHSDPGYLKLAGQSKCRFYDALITDLLRTSEGRVKNIIVTYVTTKGSRETSVLSKKDFLQKVVSVECPESMKMISAMSLKNLDATVKEVNFDLPTGEEQCHSIHLGWLSNPKTPYLCQIHEYISEANANAGENRQRGAGLTSSTTAKTGGFASSRWRKTARAFSRCSISGSEPVLFHRYSSFIFDLLFPAFAGGVPCRGAG